MQIHSIIIDSGTKFLCTIRSVNPIIVNLLDNNANTLIILRQLL